MVCSHLKKLADQREIAPSRAIPILAMSEMAKGLSQNMSFIHEPTNPESMAPAMSLSNLQSQSFLCPKSSQGRTPGNSRDHASNPKPIGITQTGRSQTADSALPCLPCRNSNKAFGLDLALTPISQQNLLPPWPRVACSDLRPVGIMNFLLSLIPISRSTPTLPCRIQHTHS